MKTMKEFIKGKIAIIVMTLIYTALTVFTTMFFSGCKTTIEIPKGLNSKCKMAWALLIVVQDSSKDEATKSAAILVLQKQVEQCNASIDKERVIKASLKCKAQVYKDDIADLSDLQKKEAFINCVKIEEGLIK